MINEQKFLSKERLKLSHSGIVQIPVKDGVIGDPTLRLNENNIFEGGSMLKMTIGAIAIIKSKTGSLAIEEVNPLLEKMIIDSSNEATEVLVNIVGRDFIGQTMNQFGMKQSRLYDPISKKLSRVTPLEMAHFLTKLLSGEIIQDETLMLGFKSMLGENKTRSEWLSLPKGVSFFGIPSVIRSRGRIIGKHVVNFGGWFEFDNNPRNGGIIVVCNKSLVGSINELIKLTSQQISGFVNSL